MDFIRQLPSHTLSSYIKYYWYFELTEAEVPCSDIGFPYGAFELIYYAKNPNKMRWLHGKEEFYEPRLCYAGQLTKPFTLKFDEPCVCAGISLQPWTGNLLFKVPADHFKDNLVQLPDISNDQQFPERLDACHTAQDIFSVFEEYLVNKLDGVSIDPVGNALAKALIVSPDHETLQSSIDKIGLTRRRIEQRFKESVGLNLGMFLRKTRFHRSLNLLSNPDGYNKLTDLSFDLGYYDQSHFIHEFKRFAGISPTEYLDRRSDLADFFQSLTQPAIS